MRPKPSAAAAKQPKSRKPAKAPTLAERAKEAWRDAQSILSPGWHPTRMVFFMHDCDGELLSPQDANAVVAEQERVVRKAIRLAVAAERERCAIIVEETAETHGSTLAGSGSSGAHIFAAAIRSGAARKGARK